MRFTRFLAFGSLFGLGACQVDEPGPPVDDGGQSGTAIPDGCYEVRREPVADVTTVAPGFDHAPQDAMADLVGAWAGSGEIAGEPVDVTFDVAWDGGAIEAVYLEWHESSGTGLPMGAPEGPATSPEACDPYYAFGLATSLSALPFLEADGQGPLYRTMGDTLYFVARTDVAEVGGTLEPEAFDPADWDRASLAAGFEQAFDGTVSLSLLWWGENDVTERASTGTASTGTVPVSGITEPITTITPLTRAD